MLIRNFPNKEKFKQLAKECNVIPLCVEILADTETPVSLLNKMYNQRGPVFLLESVEGGERWGRYSFLSASARAQIKVFPDKVEIREEDTVKNVSHDNDPFPILREIVNRYKPAVVPELPRFWGGMVGYFTYESVSFVEKIPNMLPAEKPLAHFMIPDELLIFDNIRHTLFALVICFIDDDKNLEAIFNAAKSRLSAMIEIIEKPSPVNGKCTHDGGFLLKTPLEAETYRQMVQKTKDYIKAGDIIQAVISQPFISDSPPDNWMLYRAQRFINPSPYLFFMHLNDLVMVGSSPETMVRLENRIATLRPIAGTRHRGKNEQEDRALADELLQDEKERAEHLMLVDLGRNDLGRVAEIGSVQVTDLMIVERYSHVMHLVSNITCDLKPEYDAWDLFQATFPAGTLSGAPKVRAMEIIAELENTPRGPYGGAVGYVSFNGNMDLAITIRTACIEDGRLTIRAGAGIVADSDPEKERIETNNKAMAIQRAIQMVYENM